jgi:hypothetical protein
VRPKRSIIYDEIGDRLGRGRKGDRPLVRTPAGASRETKRKALEWAKRLVVHRHFKEVQQVYESQVAFLMALDEWWLERMNRTRPSGWQTLTPSETDVDSLLAAIKVYYRENGLDQSEEHTLSDGAVEEPMLATDGREMFHGRPRPRKRHSNNEQILEKS